MIYNTIIKKTKSDEIGNYSSINKGIINNKLKVIARTEKTDRISLNSLNNLIIFTSLSKKKKNAKINIITLDLENLAKEHICCAMDSKTSTVGVTAKKE